MMGAVLLALGADRRRPLRMLGLLVLTGVAAWNKEAFFFSRSRSIRCCAAGCRAGRPARW